MLTFLQWMNQGNPRASASVRTDQGEPASSQAHGNGKLLKREWSGPTQSDRDNFRHHQQDSKRGF